MRTPSTPQAQCGNCTQPMEELGLEGHYKRLVSVDACFNCHHFWFDQLESVRLSGWGLTQLLRQMIASPKAVGTIKAQLDCVRCKAALKSVRNLSRFGRFAALECPNNHGQYQSFSLLLAELGFVRPMATQDRQVLRDEGRELECMNCGANQPNAVGGAALAECTHCRSPLVMIDLPRLTRALLLRHGDEITVDEPAQRLGLACTGCGAALDPTIDTRCGHCDHPVALPSLRHVATLLDKIEPILKGKLPREARPWGHKLKAMRGDASATQLHRLMGGVRRDVLGGWSLGGRLRSLWWVVALVLPLAVLAKCG
jgi:hypothetical protein